MSASREVEHQGLQVGLGELHLAEAVDVLVRHDADDRMAADDGAAEGRRSSWFWTFGR